ncbi:MAG: hypothetical protein AAF202_08720, partial [Pseudomonadota bacterium]
MKQKNTSKILESLKKSFDDLHKSSSFSEAQSPNMRNRAMDHFVKKGFPTTKDEFWKYTELNKHLKRSLALLPESDKDVSAKSLFESSAEIQLVFLNGALKTESSRLGPALQVRSLGSDVSEQGIDLEEMSEFA